MGEHHFGNEHHSRDLLGPYVLGESSVEEERELKHHLQGCPECRSELDHLRRAHEFIRGVPPVSPPPELKDRVLAQVKSRAPTRLRRRWRTPLVIAATFLVAALLGGGLLLAYTGGYEERVALASTALAPEGTGEVRLREAGENVEVELEVRGLPEPREDEYYELWFVDDDGRMSGGTFQVGPEGRASVNLTAPAVARTYPTVGITREPDDGDPRSSGEKVLGGELQNS